MKTLKTSCAHCRREGKKLFLKGEKCLSVKCPFVKRSYAPGVHGQKPKKLSSFGEQLREKQKVKRSYGLRETQFKNYFKKASRKQAETGLLMLQLLETRLDSVVYKLGLAPSRMLARQIVGHKHILVNGRMVNIPSYQVSIGDEITVSVKFKKSKAFEVTSQAFVNNVLPEWLKFDAKNATGKLERLPARDEVDQELKENVVVEFYSR